MPQLDGYITQDGDGFECTKCGDRIEQGEDCVKADYAEVTTENGHARVKHGNYGGIWHTECFQP